MRTMLSMTTALLLFAEPALVQAGVTAIYPFPTSMPAGTNFQVWADGQAVSVWRADADADIANFAYKDSVTVRVRFKSTFTSAKVTPGIYGIAVTKTAANEATFVLKNPQKSRIVLCIDDNPANDLFVFGDPPVDPAPAGAVVYDAGSHTVNGGYFEFKSNTTYYLAPGAVLHAQVAIPDNATNVKILGRGVIDAVFNGYMEHCFTIGNNCSNIEMNGIILTNDNFPDYMTNGGYLDLHQLVIRGYNAHTITVTNFKTIADYFTSDGLVFSGCQNVTVQDCFVVSADNNIVPGWDGLTKNININRTVLHGTRGIYTAPLFPQGAYNSGVASSIDSFHIKDLYISQTMGRIMGCTFGNSFDKVSNFLVENVYFDRIFIYDDPNNAWAVPWANQFIGMEKAPSQGGAATFRNVHWVEDKADEGYLITGWTITYDNVFYKNRLIQTPGDAHLTLAGGKLIVANSGVTGLSPRLTRSEEPAKSGAILTGTGSGAGSVLTVNLPGAGAYSVCDARGRTLVRGTARGPRTCALSRPGRGLYVVRVRQEDGNAVVRNVVY